MYIFVVISATRDYIFKKLSFGLVILNIRWSLSSPNQNMLKSFGLNSVVSID